MKNIGYRGLVSVALLTAALMQAGCSKSSSGGDSGGGAGPALSKAKGPSSLPANGNGVTPSADRVTIDQAIARANQENKKVLLEVSAAWCGPCTEFANDMEGHPEYLQDLTNTGYIMVKAEFEKMVTGGGLDFLTLNDYMPVFIGFFPSFYVYSNGTWTGIGSLNTYNDLKTTLAGNITPMTFAEVKAAVQENKSTNNVVSRLVSSIFGNFVGVYTYSEARDLARLMTANANKSATYQSLGKFMLSYIWEYVGINAVTAQQLAADFPDAGAMMLDASNAQFNIEPFNYQLSTIWRTSGLKQASSQCQSQWQTYRAQIQPGKLSAADFQTKMGKLDISVQVACAHLEWLITGVTPALTDKVSKIDKTRNKDWALLAAIGDVTTAVGIFHTRYQEYADDYTKALASDATDLDNAKKSGDQTQIDQAQHALDIDNFRAKYHAQVDADVEADLQNGKAVQTLKIVN
jgi:hypothetical protein